MADLVSLGEGEDGEPERQQNNMIQRWRFYPNPLLHSTNLLFISALLSFLYSPIISASSYKTLDSFHSEQMDTRRAASASSAAQRAFDKIQFAASSRPTRGPALIHPRPHKLNSPRGHPSHSAPSGFLAFCYYTSHIDHKMTLQSFFSNSFSSEFNLISVLTYKVLNNPAPSYPKSLVVSRYPHSASVLRTLHTENVPKMFSHPKNEASSLKT